MDPPPILLLLTHGEAKTLELLIDSEERNLRRKLNATPSRETARKLEAFAAAIDLLRVKLFAARTPPQYPSG